MERDIRYITVGVTVAVLVGMLIAFLLWQAQRYATPGGEQYAVHVSGAVTGLGSGSPVKYLGVNVGRVDRIALVASDLVEVRIRLNEELPINASTTARIEPEGITGRSYVALRTEDPEAGPATRRGDARLPVIPAEPSNLDRLLQRLPELVEDFSDVAGGLNELLSQENREDLSRMAANLANFSERLDGLAGRTESVMASFDGLTARAGKSMDEVDATLIEARATLAAAGEAMPELKLALANLAEFGAHMNRLADDSFERLSAETLPELDRLLRDGRRAANAIEDLARRLEAEPSALVHRRIEGGVEIAR